MFGVNMSILISDSGTPITNAMRLLHRCGANAMQICLGDMKDLNNIIKINSEDQTLVNKIRSKYGIYVVIHGKYIYNFCHSDKPFYNRALLKELSEGNKIGADVVIHQGKNVNKFDPIKARQVYVTNIKSIICEMVKQGLTNRIILENSAHQGTEIGYSLDELHAIWDMFSQEEKQYLGICIDTCHIFVAGELDVRESSDVQRWFQRFDLLIGRSNLKVVHFNDSSPAFGACNDHHAGLGRGEIGMDGLRTVAKICASWNIPIITETPIDGMQYEIELMKNWIVVD